METTIKALYLGAKVTEFETSRYLKVFLSALSEDEDPSNCSYSIGKATPPDQRK